MTNLLKSIALEETPNTGSSDFTLHDIEFDSGTDEYFYLGHFVDNSDNFHFISKFNNIGDQVWSKLYANHSVQNSLEYAPVNGALYYLTDANPPVLMRVSSSDGTSISSYQLTDSSIVNNYGGCSLSGDELALF